MRRKEISDSHAKFRVHSTQERRDKKKSVEILTDGLHNPINIYLWLHGVGFAEENKSCVAPVMVVAKSVLFLAFEGSVLLVGLASLNYVRLFGMNSKYAMAKFAIASMNFVLRLLIVAKRGRMKDTLRKVIKIYAKICDNKKPIDAFKRKLIFALAIHDVYLIAFLYCAVQDNMPLILSTFEEKPSYATLLLIRVSQVLYVFSLVCAAVTAYFSTVCFVLKETLSEFNKKLRGKIDYKYLSGVYSEIMDIIYEIEAFFSLFLILNFAQCLFMAFASGCFNLFLLSDKTSAIRYWNILATILLFAICCLSSTSVMKAAAEVKHTSRRLSYITPKPEGLEFILQEEFSGFKIFNSVVIDSSLILTSLGALISYGFLLATFDASHCIPETEI